jgi:SET domain-containing protein
MLNSHGKADGNLRFNLGVRKSNIDGLGAYALVPVPARRKIGEFEGERISLCEARKRASLIDRIAIIEVDNYAAIDGSKFGNNTRFVNHSCSPNTYIRVCHGRIEFYALRDIVEAEELTCYYGETHHEGKRRCTCNSKNCRGFL